MKVTQQCYYLPGDMNPEQLSALVATALTALRLRDAGAKTLARTFLDTYDWRVYGAGMIAEQESVDGADGFDFVRLWSLNGSRREATAQVTGPVRFAQDLPRGYEPALLEPVLAMRALLPLASLRVEAHTWELTQ